MGTRLNRLREPSSSLYPQCMLWIKNKNIMYTPENPSFAIYVKVGFKEVYISQTCFPGACHINLSDPGDLVVECRSGLLIELNDALDVIALSRHERKIVDWVRSQKKHNHKLLS